MEGREALHDTMEGRSGRIEEEAARHDGGKNWQEEGRNWLKLSPSTTYFLHSAYLLPHLSSLLPPSSPPPLSFLPLSFLLPPTVLPISSQLPPTVSLPLSPSIHPFPSLLFLTSTPVLPTSSFLPSNFLPVSLLNSSQYHTHFLHSSYLFLSSLLLPLSPPLPKFLSVSSLPTSSQYTS
jgi:hypothetical protein